MILLWSIVRGFFGYIFLILWTLFIAFSIFILGSFKQTKIVNIIIYAWVSLPLKILGIEVKSFGRENLPRQRGAIFVFNHQSIFDILAVHLVTDIQIRFGAKIELFKIPIFGHGMRAAGALPIVRENRTEVFKVYKEAESRIAAGESFILAPEGTRQKQPQIGKFKKGPFMFAVNAKAPIIPTVLVGCFEVMPKGDLLPNLGRMKRLIEVHYLKPVETLGKENEIAELTLSVQTDMKKCFDERHKLMYPEKYESSGPGTRASDT